MFARRFMLVGIISTLFAVGLAACSKDKYMDSHLSEKDANKLEKQVTKDGDALVTQLGPFEDEYDLIHTLVFKFMNEVVREFPGRTIHKSSVNIHNPRGRFHRGKVYSHGSKATQLDEQYYSIPIENINNLDNIKHFYELAKSIFVPAGFKTDGGLPTRKMKNGLYDFDWWFVKPSGISDSNIKWKNESSIRIGGENALVIGFSTDTRIRRKDLAEYKQAHSTASVHKD